jgi:thiol:disulfide interchange protein DsbC
MKLFALDRVLSIQKVVGKFMKFWKNLFTLAATFASLSASAASENESYDMVKNKLQNSLGMTISSIGDAPVSGLLQVMTDKGLFYISQDGKYLLQARVYNIDEGMRNETESAMGGARLGGLANFEDAMIEYKAKDEKYVVSIFTDITCGYCRKLHNEMSEYNDLGITVRYLAFPRGGLKSRTYADMVSVWCADDKQGAMDNAKAGGTVASKRCETKVAEQYAFGQKVGVTGTPNIIMPDGSVIPGYQPPKKLEQALKALL